MFYFPSSQQKRAHLTLATCTGRAKSCFSLSIKSESLQQLSAGTNFMETVEQLFRPPCMPCIRKTRGGHRTFPIVFCCFGGKNNLGVVVGVVVVTSSLSSKQASKPLKNKQQQQHSHRVLLQQQQHLPRVHLAILR